MLREGASDLYLTTGCLPSLRLDERIIRVGTSILSDEDVSSYIDNLLTPEQRDEYETTLEFNTAIPWENKARFRINVYKQQQSNALVIRNISTSIPTIEMLGLPPTYSELIMKKHGLVLVVGPTGSGKTTSLAAMIGHRNRNGFGHIVTIEDPIEFVHSHEQCIVSQRDVGIDTFSYGMALKNALRQRPDVILIGEIRDRETMEHAITFAETGHLCVATLHSNNANQTIERILGFFPEDKHPQILSNLSLNLRGILSQRLVPTIDGKKRALAMEILINNGFIKQLIEDGKVRQLKEMIERGNSEGMVSHDQSLMKLWADGIISEETAVAESDNSANLRLAIRQQTIPSIKGREEIFKLSGAPKPTQSEF